MIDLKEVRSLYVLALLPGLFWNAGPKTARDLKGAGIEQVNVPSDKLGAWKKSGLTVTGLSDQELRGRIKLIVPGINRKVQVASATTAPWVDANGWRIRREPGRDYLYDIPAGSAPLAAAEAFTYGAKALFKIDPADLDAFGKMLHFLKAVPEQTVRDVADFGFIDDGSAHAGEILNLLSRRNLLFRIVRAPDSQLRLNVSSSADDPHLFAAKVREKLKDEERSLRVYGSEVVLCRVNGDEGHARVQVLNYGGSPQHGVRLRIRGSYAKGKIYAPGSAGALADYAVLEGFTEFSIPELQVFAVVDLER